jgi:hypothetical protein
MSGVGSIQALNLEPEQRAVLRLIEASEMGMVTDLANADRLLRALRREGLLDRWNRLTERGRDALELCS